MAANNILVDSSFLYALNDPSDKYHAAASFFAEREKYERLIPDVALTEVTQLLYKSVGQRAVLGFMQMVTRGGYQLVAPQAEDIDRAREIMARYSSANLDFVDCCIMALSERLDVTRVCTFDRRDFSIFRPKHCDYLELLP